jgi:hypothetical protein
VSEQDLHYGRNVKTVQGSYRRFDASVNAGNPATVPGCANVTACQLHLHQWPMLINKLIRNCFQDDGIVTVRANDYSPLQGHLDGKSVLDLPYNQ